MWNSGRGHLCYWSSLCKGQSWHTGNASIATEFSRTVLPWLKCPIKVEAQLWENWDGETCGDQKGNSSTEQIVSLQRGINICKEEFFKLRCFEIIVDCYEVVWRCIKIPCVLCLVSLLLISCKAVLQNHNEDIDMDYNQDIEQLYATSKQLPCSFPIRNSSLLFLFCSLIMSNVI